MRTVSVAAVAACLAVIGCGRAKAPNVADPPGVGVVLDTPERLMIYSIDGTTENDKDPANKSRESFHGYPVLGKVEVLDEAERGEVIRAFGRALRTGPYGECFWPRHAIRAVTKGKAVDYVICYQCARVESSGGGGQSPRPTGGSSRDVLNRHLKGAGVPLVEGAEGP